MEKHPLKTSYGTNKAENNKLRQTKTPPLKLISSCKNRVREVINFINIHHKKKLQTRDRVRNETKCSGIRRSRPQPSRHNVINRKLFSSQSDFNDYRLIMLPPVLVGRWYSGSCGNWAGCCVCCVLFMCLELWISIMSTFVYEVRVDLCVFTLMSTGIISLPYERSQDFN